VTDTELFLRINGFARATGWLHPLMTGWANYGIIAFAVLLLLGWWRARPPCRPGRYGGRPVGTARDTACGGGQSTHRPLNSGATPVFGLARHSRAGTPEQRPVLS